MTAIRGASWSCVNTRLPSGEIEILCTIFATGIVVTRDHVAALSRKRRWLPVFLEVNAPLHFSRRLIDPEALRFAAFFSSVAGRFGNRGQADYAAANEALNKLRSDLPGVEIFPISGVSKQGVEQLLETLWKTLQDIKSPAPV